MPSSATQGEEAIVEVREREGRLKGWLRMRRDCARNAAHLSSMQKRKLAESVAEEPPLVPGWGEISRLDGAPALLRLPRKELGPCFQYFCTASSACRFPP